MPAKNPRISTVVEEEAAWAKVGEERLKAFDPDAAVSHEKAWSRSSTRNASQDSLKGTVKILGDVVEPVLPAEAWEVEGEPGLVPTE